MKLPPSHTARYKVYEAIYEYGPINLAGLIEKLPKVTKETIRSALQAGRENDILAHKDGDWSATSAAINYFDGLETQPKYVGEIVPPRVINVWTPEMRGYEANLMKLRRAA